MSSLENLVTELSNALRAKGLTLACAESCTGGMIASAITDRPGASTIFDRGFVTYSNGAKIDCITVPEWIISVHGAVSAECARAMAHGTLDHSPADLALAVTGIAGPDGGSDEKPVGLVFIAGMRRTHEPIVTRHIFNGNRAQIRAAAVEEALRLGIQLAAI